MTEFTLEDLDYATVDFKVSKMKSAQTAWINRSAHRSLAEIFQPTSLYDSQAACKFKGKFAYGIVGNDKFDEILFDEQDSVEAFGERYGGVGTSDNGGGVRCGNVNGFQIKGLGQNPLVGSGKDGWHAYGCLSMVEAILEAVNSLVLNRALPVGAATCYGLIWTGENTSCPPSESGKPETGPGALLIRDVCLRPAHFYRCNRYSVPSRYKHEIPSDVFRTRQVNRQLTRKLGGQSAVVRALGQFLSACAKQFAFARLHRILHGAISPSNVSLDGRWLDLTTTTFIDGCRNVASYPQNLPFLEEWTDIHVIVEEFLYNFGKYTLRDFDVLPLSKYYNEQYEANLVMFSSGVLGLPLGLGFGGKNIDSLRMICSCLVHIASSKPEVDFNSPRDFDVNDPMVLFLERLFLSLRATDAGFELYRGANIKGPISSEITVAYMNLLEEAYESEFVGTGMTREVFLKKTMIKALRKAYFSALFYKEKLLGHIRTFMRSARPENISGFIERYDGAAQWLYGDMDTSEDVVVAWSPGSTITMKLSTGAFEYSHGESSSNSEEFYSIATLKQSIEEEPYRVLRISGYSLKKNLIRMLEQVEVHEMFTKSVRPVEV